MVLSENWEFVKGSRRNKPYIRRVPLCRTNPSRYQRIVRYSLAKVSHDSIGKTGTVQYGNKTIPAVAHAVAQEMKGRQFAPAKPPRVPEILERFKSMFEEIGNQVGSMKPINSTVIPRLLQWQRLEEQRKKEKLRRRVAA